MINGIYLLLGSNTGDRNRYLQEARRILSLNDLSIVEKSSLYLSPPWGKTDQPYFLNQVLNVSTQLEPELLMAACLRTENELGRKRLEKYGPRTIDIDLLYYHGRVCATELLTLPHPRIHARRFVLVPLTEIAPDFVHPVLKKTQTELLRECPDPLPVRKLPG